MDYEMLLHIIMLIWEKKICFRKISVDSRVLGIQQSEKILLLNTTYKHVTYNILEAIIWLQLPLKSDLDGICWNIYSNVKL